MLPSSRFNNNFLTDFCIIKTNSLRSNTLNGLFFWPWVSKKGQLEINVTVGQ